MNETILVIAGTTGTSGTAGMRQAVSIHAVAVVPAVPEGLFESLFAYNLKR